MAAPIFSERAAVLHLDLDGAWDARRLEQEEGIATLNLRQWGPRLRFIARREEMEAFYREVAPQLPPWVLVGSGDFHHLAALWLRRCEEPVTLISFDNHPDWDTRPPHWCCGSWVSRALESPLLESASVWGCGNFEFDWPHRLFANPAVRTGRLRVHPWEERLRQPQRWEAISRSNWREAFQNYAATLAGKRLYVTIDLDALCDVEVATNWENGLFHAEEIAWALGELRQHGEIVGGDLCGAWSPQEYARFGQRFAARWDHPRVDVDPATARKRNHTVLRTLLPAFQPGEKSKIA